MLSIIVNYEPLLQTIKKRKPKWYRHISRHDGFYKTIMQVMVEGVRQRGRQKKQWLDIISDWTNMNINDLVNVIHDQDGRRKCILKSSVLIPTTIFESRD